MLKALNLIITSIIIIFIFCNPIYATDINMNLENNTNSLNNNISSSTNSSLPTSSTTTTVSALSNLPEANLGLTNILNIILIVLGILLILLGIAIFIRLK